jgi:hypothetical protein
MQIHQGGCLCSAIRFRISGTPLFSSLCHCATCRRASAAPTVAWLTVERAHFQMLSGSPHLYRSSQGVVRRFCRSCGSQLTYENTAHPNTIDITTLSLDNPNAFAPTLEVWLEHRISWQVPSQTLTPFLRGTDHGAYAGVPSHAPAPAQASAANTHLRNP